MSFIVFAATQLFFLHVSYLPLNKHFILLTYYSEKYTKYFQHWFLFTLTLPFILVRNLTLSLTLKVLNYVFALRIHKILSPMKAKHIFLGMLLIPTTWETTILNFLGGENHGQFDGEKMKQTEETAQPNNVDISTQGDMNQCITICGYMIASNITIINQAG